MHGLGEQGVARFGTGSSNREISRVITFIHILHSKCENFGSTRFYPESSKNLRIDALFQKFQLLSSFENNSANGTLARFAMETLRMMVGMSQDLEGGQLSGR